MVSLPDGLTDVRADVRELRQGLDLAGIVAGMKRQIEAPEAEVAEVRRRA